MARRRPPIRVVVAALAVASLAATASAEGPPHHYPWAKRVAAAKRFAEHRVGRISFAVVDEDGRMHGSHPDRVHNSASVVKVLFMVTLLRQKRVRDDALTESGRHLLGPMIKVSDNAAASAVYNRVGERALYRGCRPRRARPLQHPTDLGADDDHGRHPGPVHVRAAEPDPEAPS